MIPIRNNQSSLHPHLHQGPDEEAGTLAADGHQVHEDLQEPSALLAVSGGELEDCRDEAETVRDHGAFHHVQLRQHHEDEQAEAHYVHRLEDPDNEEVREGGAPA